MGFFDSFSKKNESTSFKLSELPAPPMPLSPKPDVALSQNIMSPPPLPTDNQKTSVPLNKSAIPPPLIPQGDIKGLDSTPKPTTSALPNMNPIQGDKPFPALPQVVIPPPPKIDPPQYMKTESVIEKLTPKDTSTMDRINSFQSVPSFGLPSLPKKETLSERKVFTISKSAPSALPSMPSANYRQNWNKLDILGSFADTYEEVPYFKEPQVLVDLPAMDIADSEPSNMPIKQSMDSKKPLFIRTDDYSNVLSTIDTINDYITLSTDTIYSLENLKKNTELEHNNYKSVMEDIQRKLIYIDKLLFEKGVA